MTLGIPSKRKVRRLLFLAFVKPWIFLGYMLLCQLVAAVVASFLWMVWRAFGPVFYYIDPYYSGGVDPGLDAYVGDPLTLWLVLMGICGFIALALSIVGWMDAESAPNAPRPDDSVAYVWAPPSR